MSCTMIGPKKHLRNRLDLRGRRFGRLTVLREGQGGRYSNGERYRDWVCQCDCGNTVTIRYANLRNGHTQSCGCYRTEMAHIWPVTHGMKRTRTYHIWCNIKERCYNQNNKRWDRYGGRGIIVCPAWRESFLAFFNDMGEAPTGKSIDRIDNDGPYCPFNCRWSTNKEQCNNRKGNVNVTFQGETKTLRQWAEFAGLTRSLVYDRVHKLGWPIERAITEPVKVKYRNHGLSSL